MNNGIQLISLKSKKFWVPNEKENKRKLFLISDETSREEFIEYFKTEYEELDLRTVRFERDYGNFISMNDKILAVDSELGIVTVEY